MTTPPDLLLNRDPAQPLPVTMTDGPTSSPGQASPTAPSPSHPATPGRRDEGLFRKRPDAIGPAPLFFSIALGATFGLSIGLMIGQPIIGVVFGAMLGALYGVIRRNGHGP